MTRTVLVVPLLSLVLGCARSAEGSRMSKSIARHDQQDERVAMTYVGFHGKGAPPPPPALGKAVRERFPDAKIVAIEDGHLAIVTAARTGAGSAADALGDLRERQNAAAATVGSVGDEVDFPMVASDCGLTFLTPVPLPVPPPARR